MSDITPGLERLDFSYDGRHRPAPFPPVMVGVVGSGNLEVLVEGDAGAGCRVHVDTSARGFGPIWQAVLDDFHARHGWDGVRISINDMGATPAVVGLRLEQAANEVEARP